jgi:diacylglycerol kinase family enzyme
LIEIGWDANAAWSAGLDDLPVRLTGGDLLTSLGGPSSGATVNRFPVDLLRVAADGDELVALAHVIARGRTWWRGPISAVFNADHVGRWDVVPKAHPGDGRFDIVEVDGGMPVRARWQAWRRLPTGTHLPHPMIHVRQADAMTWEFAPPRRLWVDGVAHGAVHRLEVTMSSEGVVVYT